MPRRREKEEEVIEYAAEPLTNMEIRQAWLQCLTSASMLFDPKDEDVASEAGLLADEYLAQFRARFDQSFELPEDDEEEEDDDEPQRRRVARG